MHQTYVDGVASIAILNGVCEMKPHSWQYNERENKNKATEQHIK